MIPEIDVRGCLARKQFAGETEFEWEGAQELLTIPFVRFASPVRFSLRYEIGEDGCVAVGGKVSFVLTGLCSRCLKEATAQFESEADGRFVPHPSDGEDYSYRNGKADLGEFVRDAVLIALPGVLHCESCARED